jgi:hypothetical protein
MVALHNPPALHMEIRLEGVMKKAFAVLAWALGTLAFFAIGAVMFNAGIYISDQGKNPAGIGLVSGLSFVMSCCCVWGAIDRVKSA